jgi:hypothetical protein
MSERIIGVAVRLDGEVYPLLAPARHGQAIRLITACMPDDPDAGLKAEQGFVTDRARFVTREEARELVKSFMKETSMWSSVMSSYVTRMSVVRKTYPRAENHGEPDNPEPSRHPTELFSEDLW